jgi:nucleoside diphosphate kinase
MLPSIFRIRLLFLFIILIPFCSQALGVLTHEAIVDAAWDKTILPLLKQRYPGASAENIKEAHAYAYGGAVAPDMGYYPSGSEFFTNLVHYVRSGDMVNALLKEAETLNQFAFALGFLSHYNADHYGHPLATNISVPLLYPKMKRKFGTHITYANNKISHIRMEFGFDVLQVAKGNYVSQTYRELIGFKVDTTVLAKAFKKVYGLSIHEVHANHFSRSVETFRWVVANIFPLITRQAWAARKNNILKNDSTATAQRFNYKMRQKVYAKNFGTGYKRPGFFPTLVSFFIRVLPKAGPLRPLKFKVPTPEAEKYFVQSFDTIMFHYTQDMKKLLVQELDKKDIDFDTGKPTDLCEYSLADETDSDLLLALKGNKFAGMSTALKENILIFYKGVNGNGSKLCIQFWEALKELRN